MTALYPRRAPRQAPDLVPGHRRKWPIQWKLKVMPFAYRTSELFPLRSNELLHPQMYITPPLPTSCEVNLNTFSGSNGHDGQSRAQWSQSELRPLSAANSLYSLPDLVGEIAAVENASVNERMVYGSVPYSDVEDDLLPVPADVGITFGHDKRVSPAFNGFSFGVSSGSNDGVSQNNTGRTNNSVIHKLTGMWSSTHYAVGDDGSASVNINCHGVLADEAAVAPQTQTTNGLSYSGTHSSDATGNTNKGDCSKDESK
jgi:hypothetical protein